MEGAGRTSRSPTRRTGRAGTTRTTFGSPASSARTDHRITRHEGGAAEAHPPRTTAHVLRLFRTGDAKIIAAAVGESLEHLKPWMPWADEESVDERFQRQRLRGVQHKASTGEEWQYGLFPTDESRVLGSFGLMTRQGPGSIEIGYWVHVDEIGHGLAITREPRAHQRRARTPGDLDRLHPLRREQHAQRRGPPPARLQPRTNADPRPRSAGRIGSPHDLGAPLSDHLTSTHPTQAPHPGTRASDRPPNWADRLEPAHPGSYTHLGTFTPKRTWMSGWG